MKTNQNKVQLVGYAGMDMQVREFKQGNKVAHFSLGTHEYFKNKLGEWVETTAWHKVVLWNKHVDMAQKAVKKGLAIAVTGRLRYRFYETQSGVKKFLAEVIASEVKLVA